MGTLCNMGSEIMIDEQEYMRNLIEINDYLKFDEKRNYIPGHRTRFLQAIEMLDNNIKLDDFKILEVGSDLPYISLPFLEKVNLIEVCCNEFPFHGFKGDSLLKQPLVYKNKIYFRFCNMNTDDFGRELWDLIIATEIWEHLPCDLFEAKNRLVKAIKPNKFLFVSFPIRESRNVFPLEEYHKRLYDDLEKPYGHLRNFSPSIINKFLEDLEIIDKQTLRSQASGGQIIQVLCRKRGESN